MRSVIGVGHRVEVVDLAGGQRHAHLGGAHELAHHRVDDEARPGEHALVAGPEHRLGDQAQQLVAAVADDHVLVGDAEVLGRGGAWSARAEPSG